jgi:hypothetical protein
MLFCVCLAKNLAEENVLKKRVREKYKTYFVSYIYFRMPRFSKQLKK